MCNAMFVDPGEAACMAANENCTQCEESMHFAASLLCSTVENKFESGNLQAAQESDTHTETASRIVDERAVKSNSVVTKVGRNFSILITKPDIQHSPQTKQLKWF